MTHAVLEKGTQVLYFELEQKDVSKRYVLANATQSMIQKLQILISQYPGITLVRTGIATVTSADETLKDLSGIQGIASVANVFYNLDFMGSHPVINSGQARYSQDLVEQIERITIPAGYEEPIQDVAQGQMHIADVTTPEEISPLAEQLKSQIEEPAKTLSMEELLNSKLQSKKTNKAILTPIPETNTAVSNAQKIADEEMRQNGPLAQEVSSTSENALLPKEAIKIAPETKTPARRGRPPKEKAEVEVTPTVKEEVVEEVKTTSEQKKEDLKNSLMQQVNEKVTLGVGRKQKGKLDLILDAVLNIQDNLGIEDVERAKGESLLSDMTVEEFQAWFWETHDESDASRVFKIILSELSRA